MKALIAVILFFIGLYLIFISSAKEEKIPKKALKKEIEKKASPNKAFSEPDLSDLEVDFSQSLESQVWKDIAEEKRKQKLSEIEKELFVKKMMERAEAQGYQIRVSEDLEVISVKPLKRKVKPFKFKHLD